MFAFFDYLRNITYYLLFAALVGFIAPAGKYKKFVSLVMGLVLLTLILQPIRGIVATQIPVTDWFVGIIPQGQASQEVNLGDPYTIWRDNHLTHAFEAQLSTQLENLLERNGFALHHASFTYTEDFSRIETIHVTVSRQDPAQAETRRPFIRIEPVQINRDTPQEDPAVYEIKNIIAGFYNLPHSHIHVKVNVS